MGSDCTVGQDARCNEEEVTVFIFGACFKGENLTRLGLAKCHSTVLGRS